MAELAIISFPDEPTALDVGAQPEAVAAAAGGDTFRGASGAGIWVENTSGAPRTVTIDAVRDCNHGVEHDSAVPVPDGFTGFIAASLRAGRFVDALGMISLTYDSEVGLRVAAVLLE